MENCSLAALNFAEDPKSRVQSKRHYSLQRLEAQPTRLQVMEKSSYVLVL